MENVAHKELSVLIIDDDQEEYFLLSSALKKFYSIENVQGRSRGEDIIDFLLGLRNKPDVIITDLNLRGIDGLEVAESIKKHPRFRNIPVIILSSVLDEEHYQRGIAVGIDKIYEKPADWPEYKKLCGEIVELVEHH